MEADEQLENIVKYQRRFRQEDAVRLGDIAGRMVEGRISSQQKRYERISKSLNQLLGGKLLEHCEIVDIQGGRLLLRVDSPAYRQELEWCREELLRKMRQCCGRYRITDIKIVSG